MKFSIHDLTSGFIKQKTINAIYALRYENSRGEEIDKLKERHSAHIKVKVLCRKEKLQDRQKIGDTNLSVLLIQIKH